jgi:hypothetical protein
MAKKIEKTTNLTPPVDGSNNSVLGKLSDLLKTIVASIAIFTALFYFLGRLRTEAYYNALGINPSALQFSTTDYMFSSFDLVIMCLTVFILVYAYIKSKSKINRSVLLFPTATNELKEDQGRKAQSLKEKFNPILIYILWIGALYGFFVSSTISSILIGVTAGYIIGVPSLLLLYQTQKTSHNEQLNIPVLLYISLISIAAIPFMTNRLGQIEARENISLFPNVIITFKTICSPQIQELGTPTQSKTLKMITINNNTIYALDQSNSTDVWQIYTIPANDTAQIIYLHEK